MRKYNKNYQQANFRYQHGTKHIKNEILFKIIKTRRDKNGKKNNKKTTIFI